MGKMAMAAAGSGTHWAANKLAGNNNVSFSWRNVVTSAASAGSGSLLGLSDQSSMFSRFNEGAGLLNGTFDGIAGAAINYGVGKGLYNQGSWNFRDVATDAFGNALGNTAVNELAKCGSTASQGSAATDKAQKARMDKMFDSIGRKIDAKLDAQQNETLVKQQERITSELGGHADAQLSSGTALLESRNDADMVRYQTARLNLADSANMSSAAYAADAVALRSRHQTQTAKLQANTYANSVVDRPARVGIPGVTPGPWAPEFLQAPSGIDSPAWMRLTTGQYGPWRDGYIFAPSILNGSSSNDSFTLPSSQLSGLGLLTYSMEEMTKRGWGSQLNVASTPTPANKINMQLGIGAYAEPISGVRVDTRHFTPLFNELGSGVTKISVGFSGIGAYQAYESDQDGWDFGDGFREIGKLGADLAAAAPSLTKISYLTRFNPAGVAYTAADLAVQLTPDYTIQYGQYAGETRSGWTKLMYMNADQQQRVLNVSPELHYELYIRRQPKF